MTVEISQRRRREVIDALRRGTVPRNGLDVLAVGLDRFVPAVDAELATIIDGWSVFKAVRGEYGAGKTFFTRWLAERAKRRGGATAEVQISETETPLHRLETLYRRMTENLTTEEFPPSALRPVLDNWMFTLEEDVLAAGTVAEDDAAGLDAAVGELLERRLGGIARSAPTFAAALRGYRSATAGGDTRTAAGLAAWLGGQPNVAASVRRTAGVKGELDHFGAFGFLQGLLTVLRDCGHPGLLVVLDEVETLQRMRSDAQDKALNALRQLIDEVDSGRFPGPYPAWVGWTTSIHSTSWNTERHRGMWRRYRRAKPAKCRGPGSSMPLPWRCTRVRSTPRCSKWASVACPARCSGLVGAHQERMWSRSPGSLTGMSGSCARCRLIAPVPTAAARHSRNVRGIHRSRPSNSGSIPCRGARVAVSSIVMACSRSTAAFKVSPRRHRKVSGKSALSRASNMNWQRRPAPTSARRRMLCGSCPGDRQAPKWDSHRGRRLLKTG